METNNPFKVGDKVYHYSSKDVLTIIDISMNNNPMMIFAYIKGFNPLPISELSFKPYDLINGGLTHQRPVDFSILNDIDWFYVKTFYGNEYYFKGNMFIVDPKNIACSADKTFKYIGIILTSKEKIVFLRKCTEQELEEIKTIFPEEFCKPKTLFERIEHEIKMSSSGVSGIIISDEEDDNLPFQCFFDHRYAHGNPNRVIPVYRSKTNIATGKIILF